MPPPIKTKQVVPGNVASAAVLAVPTPKFVPPRMIINGVEGIGKTTIAAHAPGCAILMAKGETGYLTLLGSGLVPERPAATIDSWEQMTATLDGLLMDDQGVKVLVLDALGGFERLCHEFTCRTAFGGDWGEQGFMAFHRGYALAVNDWIDMLARLDALHKKGMAILLLSHTIIKEFKNPSGSNFDRYMTACHEKTWDVTHKWSDIVLFNTFLIDAAKVDGKVKGKGGTQRMIYTQRTDTYDAKNRYGMPPVLTLTENPQESWSIISKAIKGER